MHTLQTFTYCYTLRSFRILSDPLRVAHCIVVTCRRRRHCIHRALRCLGVVCTIETDRNNRLETETKQLEFTSKLLKHQHEAQSFHIISHIKKDTRRVVYTHGCRQNTEASLSITQHHSAFHKGQVGVCTGTCREVHTTLRCRFSYVWWCLLMLLATKWNWDNSSGTAPETTIVASCCIMLHHVASCYIMLHHVASCCI